MMEQNETKIEAASTDGVPSVSITVLVEKTVKSKLFFTTNAIFQIFKCMYQ